MGTSKEAFVQDPIAAIEAAFNESEGTDSLYQIINKLGVTAKEFVDALQKNGKRIALKSRVANRQFPVHH